MPSTRDRGRAGEQLAERFLRDAGLEIVARNVVAGGGELDLICREFDPRDGAPTIVFVEVRSRASDRRGHPAETVGHAKRRKVVRAATAWLVSRGLWERVAVRFDVVTLTGPTVEWTRDAFDGG